MSELERLWADSYAKVKWPGVSTQTQPSYEFPNLVDQPLHIISQVLDSDEMLRPPTLWMSTDF